jgi:hypothetical protein
MALLSSLVALSMIAGASGFTHSSADVKSQETMYKTPEQALDVLPFISAIPRSFFFGDGYRMKFNGQELQIDHMGYRSTAPANKRTCLISLSMLSPVAFFGSRIDFPIFHSATLYPPDWQTGSLGDYVLHFSKTAAVDHPTIQITVTARF